MNDSPITTETVDIQHDIEPANDQPPARRIPHFGHALLWLGMNYFFINLGTLVTLSLVHGVSAQGFEQHKLAAASGEVLGYILAFLVAFPLFPMIWEYRFVEGIQLNLRSASLNWRKLLLIGVCISGIAQLIIQFFPAPKHNDLLDLFSNAHTAWLVVIVAAIVPPVAEEVTFRGFLLPSLATAYDWLSLERTPAAAARWRTTVIHSRLGWVFATLLSSLAFSTLHGSQYDWSKGSLIVLFFFSVVLSIVRIKTRSVAASVITHFAYNAVPLATIIALTHGFRHLDKLK